VRVVFIYLRSYPHEDHRGGGVELKNGGESRSKAVKEGKRSLSWRLTGSVYTTPNTPKTQKMGVLRFVERFFYKGE